MPKTITLGLMSGTSLDGVDAVAVDFAGSAPRLLGSVHVSFARELHDALLALCLPGTNEIDRAGRASVSLAHAYARAIREVMAVSHITPSEVACAGVHGQTIRHRPDEGWTLQLNHPALVAELSGVDIVADFRSRDLAAGGEGAPLVPAFHAMIFRADEARAVVNIGGIANITVLPGDTSPVTGFDCGPGNMLMDAWTQKHLGKIFDENGRWAASGHANKALLAALSGDAFFTKAPPKSTGRELFNLAWLETILKDFPGVAPKDIQATLLEFTAATITDAVKRFAPKTKALFLCGGGALNPVLSAAIARRLEPVPVSSTAALGVDPMHVEAMAFAWLARAFSKREAGNLPEVTAATGPRILGALYPR